MNNTSDTSCRALVALHAPVTGDTVHLTGGTVSNKADGSISGGSYGVAFVNPAHTRMTKRQCPARAWRPTVIRLRQG